MVELSDIPDPHLVDQFLETYCALASLTARSAVVKASQEELNQLLQMIVNLAMNPLNFVCINSVVEILRTPWRHRGSPCD